MEHCCIQNTFIITLYSNLYRTAKGILLIYDITNRQTFDEIKFWLNDIENNQIKIQLYYQLEIDVIYKMEEQLLFKKEKILLIIME